MKPVIVILFALLSVVAVAQQRRPPERVNSAAKASNAPDNSKPEPSALYGYIAIIDPATGHKYGGPPGSQSEIGSGLTFPMNVVFRRKLDATQTTTLNESMGSCSYYLYPPEACWYMIPLAQDNAGTMPFYGTHGEIHYNPDQWRFLRLELGPLHWDEHDSLAASASPVHVQIPLSQTNIPFNDLPDFHGSRSGPSSVPVRH